MRPVQVACLDESAVAAIAGGNATAQRASWLAHAESCERCRQVVVAAVRAGRPAAGGNGDDSRGDAPMRVHGSSEPSFAVGSHDDTQLAQGSARAAGHGSERARDAHAETLLADGSNDDTQLAHGSDRDAALGGDATAAAAPNARRKPAIARNRRGDDERLGVGDRIGRYHITGVLGAGGMGVVYEARDPELDRLLAIKLLRDSARAAEQGLTARLVREAKALAQLAHPNVVAIHDVGEHAGCPFLAMEFIRGATLRGWLGDKPRTWREIAGVFEQAARGLAAAHAANLIHRDFKPDNVMVGTDGRVRVTDFGLVRPAREMGTVPISEAEKMGTVPMNALVTQTGALLGTPAYMSPEQHRGEPGDAKSDQFNFMVSLYEAVYGKRPFQGKTWESLAMAVLESEPAPPPPGTRVPRWLRRLIDRGLAREPAERHADMTEVADLLTRGLTRRRRTAIVAGIGGAALAAAAALTIAVATDGGECRDGSEQIAKFWNTSQKDRVRFAFLTTAKPFAVDAFRAVTRTLDDYGARWSAAYQDACEAAQSPELLDLRMSCLASRRAEMADFVELLATADAELVSRAPSSVTRLSSVDDCANVAALGARAKIPTAIRERALALQQKLGKARATNRAGEYRAALAIAQEVLQEARALPYRPLEAEALEVIAGDHERLAELAEAERTYHEAIRVAEAGGHDELKAIAWAALVAMVGENLARPKDALELEKQARAVIERVNKDQLRAELDEGVARAHQRAGNYEEARKYHEAALATFERIGGKDDLQVAVSLDGLVGLHMMKGEYKQALAAAQRALAIRTAKLGAAHPTVAKAIQNVALTQALTGDPAAMKTMQDALARTIAAHGPRHVETALARTNYGAFLEDAGRWDEAIAELEAGLALRRELLGAKHADVATSLMSLGNVYLAQGKFDLAERVYRESLVMREEVLGKDHPEVEIAAGNLGTALASKGDLDAAEAMYRRALAIGEATHGKDHPGVNIRLTNLARLATKRGKPAEAVALYLRAIASDEKVLGKDNPAVAFHLTGLASAYIDLDKIADAVAALERSVVIWEKSGVEPYRLAEDRILLAEGLAVLKRDMKRARELAEQARAAFAQDPERHREWLLYIDEWHRRYGRK